MKNSTVFAKAAKIVMERGLNKCSYGTPNGPVCMLGAFYEAATGKPDGFEEDYPDDARWMVVGMELPYGDGGVAWNDAPDTTADEVVQVLQFMALSEKDAGR